MRGVITTENSCTDCGRREEEHVEDLNTDRKSRKILWDLDGVRERETLGEGRWVTECMMEGK